MMTFRKAIEILKAHQSWRLGQIDEMPYKPLEITEALDVLLLVVDDKLEAKAKDCNWGDMEKNINEHLNKT
jgi:hypothetical protein